MTTFREKLIELNACEEGIEWLGDRTEEQLLIDCHRGDWLLWYFFKMRNQTGYPDIKQITKAKVECAMLVTHLMQDERSKIALNVAWAWANNEATDDDLSIASADAADAASAASIAYSANAYAAYSAYSAYAASNAASSASVAYASVAYASNAASDAASDAYAYAYAAVRSSILKQCADICRKYLTLPENY